MDGESVTAAHMKYIIRNSVRYMCWSRLVQPGQNPYVLTTAGTKTGTTPCSHVGIKKLIKVQLGLVAHHVEDEPVSRPISIGFASTCGARKESKSI
jgi:hypothetical protein